MEKKLTQEANPTEKKLDNSQIIYLLGEKHELFKYIFTKNIDYKDNLLISLKQIRKNELVLLSCKFIIK
jgi:hypothetical protein